MCGIPDMVDTDGMRAIGNNGMPERQGWLEGLEQMRDITESDITDLM